MPRTLRLVLFSFLFAACVSAAPTKRRAVATPPLPATTGPVSLWSTLTPGPVPVGFKAFLLRAQASEFHHGPQHFVQISVWYPAAPGSGSAMTFRDYLLLRATDNSYDAPTDAQRQAAIDAFTAPLLAAGVSQQTIAALVDSPMIARMNAVTPIHVVRSPIVFISPGNGQSAADQAVLAEFIASHGYMVATVPSVTILTGPLTSPDQIGLRAEEQQDDDDRAASQIGDWPNAINIPVTMLGYDIGVDAALFYSMLHPTNAILSLDATLSPSVATVPMYDASKQLAPIFNLYETYDQPPPDFSRFNTSFVESQIFTSMRHAHFTTLGFAAAASPEVARATGAGPNIRSDVAAMAQQVVAYLDRAWGSRKPQ